MSLDLEILTEYLEAQKELVAVESVDERTAIISLPLHFSAYTRVEISVTEITPDQYVLSDMAKTIGELKDAGFQVKDKLRQRINEMVEIQRVLISGNTLIKHCSRQDLGNAITQFGEAAKTIGDAYLVYPRASSASKIEDDVKQKVRKTFERKNYAYQERKEVPGSIENHRVDFLIHPNGAKGLALAVLPDPDRIHAEAWGFKTQDIKTVSKDRIIVGVLYNAEKAKDISRNILARIADLSVAFSEVDEFGERLEAFGVSRG